MVVGSNKVESKKVGRSCDLLCGKVGFRLLRLPICEKRR